MNRDFDSMSVMERLSLLSDAERDEVLESMSVAEMKDLSFWLRPSQVAVVEDEAPLIALTAGRGHGKTLVGSAWCIGKARQTPGCRIHLVGRTVSDVRDVMVNGPSGILGNSPIDFEPIYTPSLRKLVWPNGSSAYTFSAEKPSALRGPQSDYTWVDELATFRDVPDESGLTTWDQVRISTRLGSNPQILVTTTPRRNRVMREIFTMAEDESSRVSMHKGRTLDNAANLSPEYLQDLIDLYGGTALALQELEGEFLDEIEGALWRESDIAIGTPPEKVLVTVIAVDPGATRGGDATGITVSYGDISRPLGERRGWVAKDYTAKGRDPEQWAAAVITAARIEADLHPTWPIVVVAEKNQGGEMVSSVIRSTPGGESLKIVLVHAHKSKAARAEPVVLAYRQKRVFHVMDHPELVEEMLTWEPEAKWSPNRLDSLVWGLTAILVDESILRSLGPLRAHIPTSGPMPVAGYLSERGNTDRHRPMVGFDRRFR